MKIKVKRVPFIEIEYNPDFAILCKENAEESHIKGMPPILINCETYHELEKRGLYFSFAAYEEDKLIGYLGILYTLLPHYSVKVAMSESFFVRKRYRRTGAGLKLLKIGELFAKKLGSPGLFISAPEGSALAKILPRKRYVKTNQILYKSDL